MSPFSTWSSPGFVSPAHRNMLDLGMRYEQAAAGKKRPAPARVMKLTFDQKMPSQAPLPENWRNDRRLIPGAQAFCQARGKAGASSSCHFQVRCCCFVRNRTSRRRHFAQATRMASCTRSKLHAIAASRRRQVGGGKRKLHFVCRFYRIGCTPAIYIALQRKIG